MVEVAPVPKRFLVDASLVRRLIDAQFPQWRHLPIRPVANQGWDNQTFRLGDEMSVRLPTAKEYALAVEKEQRWLPVLGPQLPLPIPLPLGRGVPSEEYPHPWSVYKWLDGQPANEDNIADLTAFAIDLADFLAALQRIDSTDGPAPGLHNWYRGGPVATYDKETARHLETLDGHVDTDLAAEIWQTAIGASWDGQPVWFHGDVARGNLLVKDGALAAVIDFGTSGVGDAACDLAIAWTLFRGESREAFRERLSVDAATWARGRGWALWKTLATYAWAVRSGDPQPSEATYVLDQIFAEYRESAE